MNDMVQTYLNEKKAEEIKKKNELLISLGLYEKEYSETNVYSKEYSNAEYDETADQWRYYKAIPVEVTDEEYSEILKYQKTNVKTRRKNPVAVTFKVLSFLCYIGGIILGIVFGFVEETKGTYYTYTVKTFSFTTAEIYWIAGCLSGLVYRGIAEVIQLLENIKNK